MTLPYLLRLLCLCLASFFLVNLVSGLLVSLFTPAAMALASRMSPRRAERFLLWLRMFPAAISLLAVAGLCAPSYLLLEPVSGPEEVSAACLGAALLCLTLMAVSAVRCLRAA